MQVSNNYAMEAVINCVVVKVNGCGNSNHLPVRYELLLTTGQIAPSVDGSTDGDVTQATHIKQPTYVKLKWTDPLFVNTYTHNLRQELSKIPPLERQRMDRDDAQCVIDSHTNLITRAMHATAMARNRTRLFFHIWKELGRPKCGQAYECSRAATKAYKTTCRSAVNSVVHTNHRKRIRIQACKLTGQSWNEVNRAKTAANERQVGHEPRPQKSAMGIILVGKL